ncbi:3-oxoacyl-ACP reductase [Tateyamaria omphalii]|uniref:3-oxoacyl-ACP reductase n=1 Tax=Tateyamaria omphalii TaxID=299262 RepID=A0A1P8MQN7_9RHOB|nr:3-oxoacyl-ACP reductase [Tateyamaria omphalii]APX10289.1 3-oxoacyl-ACP reductase [Tateyamaria omphalii]
MTLPLDQQTVLVTGAGRGLGAAIATAFAREGAQVILNYRNSRTQAKTLASKLGPRAQAIQADITDADQIRTMIDTAKDTFGPITTVVHNALADYSFNGDARDTLYTLSPKALLAQHDTAVIGALNVIQAAAPAMEQAGFGRIITIGTNLVQNPVVPYHDYTSAKAALLALTRTAAAELGPKGITVNMVSGGLLRTTDASAATPDAVFDLIAGSTPLRSVTTPDEAADAVLFFASPWARAVTGQNLIVDGGLVFG